MCTFMTGNDGVYTESLSDECLIDTIHELLQKAFPKENFPVPKKIYRHNKLGIF